MASKKTLSSLIGASARLGEALRACEALMAPQLVSASAPQHTSQLGVRPDKTPS